MATADEAIVTGSGAVDVSGNRSTVFLVRHSERIDEVDELAWRKHLEKLKRVGGPRNIKYVADDPVLTENGKLIAACAGQLLSSTMLPSAASSSSIQAIFSSQLMRCVQTSYEIAKLLDIPIIVSKGLALTALAVKESAGKFEFASLDELRAACPGVTILSCDEDVHSSESRSKKRSPTAMTSSSSSSSSTVRASAVASEAEAVRHMDPRTIPRIPHGPSVCRDWLSPLMLVARQYPCSIIVCHRETIRNLSERRQRLPYCAVARCGFTSVVDGAETGKQNGLGRMWVESVYAADGSLVYSELPDAM